MIRAYESHNYNYVFDTDNGFFARWGKDYYDDPVMSPVGPEVLDIEVSTICHQGCSFCYKSNTAKGKNMTFEAFKSILDKMPSIMQVAFGIGSIDANPDLWEMMEYCRKIGVVPNITINGYRLTDEHVELLAKYCGAVAVSNYDLEVCLDAVNRLSKAGIKQVNIHQLLSQESLPDCWEVAESNRLENVNAVVFLSAKQKGRGKNSTPANFDDFKELIEFCLENNIRIGFDSCTANKFLMAIKDRPEFDALEMCAEPCESGLFSSYVSVDGVFYPCSFMEGVVPGIDMSYVEDFLRDVWYSYKVNQWRSTLLGCGRSCPVYNI